MLSQPSPHLGVGIFDDTFNLLTCMSDAPCEHRYDQVAVHTDKQLRNYETLYCRKCFEIAGRYVGDSLVERPSRYFPFEVEPREKLRVVVVFPMTFRGFADALFNRLAADPNIEPFGINTIHSRIDGVNLQMLRNAIPNSDLVVFLSAPKELPMILKEIAPPGTKPVIIVRPGPSLSTHELHMLALGYMVVAPTTISGLHLLIKGHAASIVYKAQGSIIQVPEIKVEMASLAQQMALALEKDPDALLKMHHRKFEELVAELMEKDGYEVELTPQSRDGGVDIYAVKSDSYGRFLVIVDCKKYSKENPIGPELVRTLYGTLNLKNASHGVIATTTRFTKDAQEEARQRQFQISLKDHADVYSWILRHGLK